MFKKVLALLLVAAMALTLCACSGGGSTSTAESTAESTAAPAGDGSQSLTVWCWDPAFNLYAMEEAEKVYQKDHPDFDLNIVETPWDDIQTAIITGASSGNLDTMPDIFLTQNNAFQKNVINYENVFTDLTDSGISFGDFGDSSVSYSTVDGKNYGVPFDNGASVFAYRTDLLAEAGLTVADFTDITWEKFIELGKQVKDKTGKPLFSFQAGGADVIVMMLKSAGSSLFNEDGTVNMVGNDVLTAAFQTYKDLIDAGVLVEYNSWDEYVASFVNGSVAGTMNGCWILASVQTAEDQSGNWAVTNIPSLTGISGATNYTENGGSSWAVCSASGNSALAIDFLKSTFAGSTELYDTILPKSSAIANWLPASESDVYAEPQEFFGGQAIYKDIVAYSENVLPFNTGVYYYEATTAIGTQVTNVVNGTDITQAIQDAQDETEFNMG